MQPAYHHLRLEHGDAAAFRRPGAGRVDRIEPVDVEADIGGPVADDGARLLDDRLGPLVVEFLHVDDAHAAVMAEAPDIDIVDAAADTDLDRPLGIEQPLLHRPPERRAVMEFRAEIIVAGVAMGIEMDHADRAVLGDGAEDRQGDRMVAARRDRHDPGGVDRREDGFDLAMRALELERFFDPGIAEIGDPAQRIGIDAGRLVDAPHQARLVADLARPVAGAGAVGHAAVERHADQPDIDPGEVLAIGRSHEGRDAGVTRPHHRIGEFRIGQLTAHDTAPDRFVRLHAWREPSGKPHGLEFDSFTAPGYAGRRRHGPPRRW